MSLLTFSEVGKQFGIQEVLRGVSFFVGSRRRVGIVGPNGAGKTTLLRIAVGTEAPDAGRVTLQPNTVVALLAQEPLVGDARTVIEAAQRPTPELQQVWQEMVALEEAALHDEAVLDQHDALHHRYQDLGGYSCQSRAKEILAGLGFPENSWDRPVSVLSGGERTRLALVQILVLQPDLLLLDEPTNHVDWAACEWLQEYLRRYPGAALIVSHDRFFLDDVVEEIVELSAARVKVYSGNYTEYQRRKAVEREQAEEAYRRQQEEIARQQAIIQRLRSHRKFDSMHSRERTLEKLQDELAERPRPQERGMKLKLQNVSLTGREALIVQDLEQGFGERTLFRSLSLLLERGERLAIVGPNGVGKSTLLRTLVGELPPRRGTVEYGFRAKPAYFDQNQSSLDPDATVWETIWEVGTLDQPQTIQALHRFLFVGEALNKLVGDLSGGEKTRLALCRVLVRNPNLLILDEPTNHLDIQSREAVERALRQFPGAVVVVSHDRFFLQAVATRILELKPAAHRLVPGGFREYREGLLPAAQPPPTKNRSAAPAPRVRPVSPSKRLPRVEAEITDFETRQQAISEKLADASVWASGEAVTLSTELEQVGSRLALLYTEWEELSEALTESRTTSPTRPPAQLSCG